MHHHAVELPDAAAVDLQYLEAGGHLPDVREADTREAAAPPKSQGQGADEREDLVAQVLAAVEAFVGIAPDAVG